MSTQEEIDQQLRLLETHRRTLRFVLIEVAKFGAGYVPPQLRHSVFEARTGIRQCKAALRGWGVAVDDMPDDEDAQPSAAEQAGSGIAAMADLLVEPDVRSSIAGFREGFELVCRQIDRLTTYKDLHDLLHDLQFNCYNPIMRGSRDFPDNSLFLESLIDYQAELQTIANGLWEIAEQAALSANERAWIEQIDRAAAALQNAIDQSSKPQFDRATMQIGRVLYIHPTRINERLKEAARDLPLPNLVQAMAAARQHAAPGDLATDKLRRIDQGIAALERLDTALADMIAEHDTWQDIDLELHRIEGDMEQHVQELEWLWPDLKARLQPLCEGRADRWSQDLRQTNEKFERALATQNPIMIAAAFRPFQRQVGLCFFQADKKLKELCHGLRQVDGPLNSLTSILHD